MKKGLVLCLCLVLLLGTVSVCAQEPELRPENMWKYVLGTDEYGYTYAILTGGKANFDAKTLTVPLTLDGYLVREIGANAFQVFDEAEEIILHESIQRIGAYAFAGLPKLQRVQIPENACLYHIEDGAFANCRRLEEITLPDNLRTLGERVFAYCVALKSLTIPQNVQFPDGMVIEYCDRLETVEVQGDYAHLGLFLADCLNLKKMIFSGDIASVDAAFPHNFFECLERVDSHDPRVFTKPREMTIVGKRATPIEETAVRIGVPFVSLKETDEKTFAAQTAYADRLKELGLFLGTEKGYELDRPMTRAEAVTMLYRVLFMIPGAGNFNATHPFTDVPDWAYVPVAMAYTGGITYGVSDTLFGTDERIPVNQYLTFMLRALGYDSLDFDWDMPYGLATHLRLLPPEVSLRDFTRGDAVAITAAALFAPLKHADMTLGEKLATMGIYPKEAFDRVFAQNPFASYADKLKKIEGADLSILEPLPTNTFAHNSALLFGEDLAYIVRTTLTLNEQNQVEKTAQSGWFYTVDTEGNVLEHHLEGVYDYEDYFPDNTNRELLRLCMSRWSEDGLRAMHAAGVLVYRQPTHDEVLSDIVLNGDGTRRVEILEEFDECSLVANYLGGVPHGGNVSMMLVYKAGSSMGDGMVVWLPAPASSFYGNETLPHTMTISDDQRTMVYTYTFAERLEASIAPSMPTMLIHEKGTYVYTVNLQTGTHTLEIIP